MRGMFFVVVRNSAAARSIPPNAPITRASGPQDAKQSRRARPKRTRSPEARGPTRPSTKRHRLPSRGGGADPTNRNHQRRWPERSKYRQPCVGYRAQLLRQPLKTIATVRSSPMMTRCSLGVLRGLQHVPRTAYERFAGDTWLCHTGRLGHTHFI